MKRSAKATVMRTVRRAVTWQPKRAGRAALDIEELISPLRYDVLVRADFFRFLRARPEDESDRSLVEAAWGEPYAVWFREVAMARFRPWVLKDQQVMQQSFGERVFASRVLLNSFQSRGFDRSRPVTLRVTSGDRRTDTGAVVHRTLHVGDGGHRLALLLQAGQPLAPDMYRLDPRPVPLIDNTAVLLGPLHLTDADYGSFIAKGYGVPPCSDLARIQQQVAAADPARAAELASVLDAHSRFRSEVR
jgi:hypothetical protein